ncbi:hypothetical protein [Caproiciproducens sp. LBM24188]
MWARLYPIQCGESGAARVSSGRFDEKSGAAKGRFLPFATSLSRDMQIQLLKSALFKTRAVRPGFPVHAPVFFDVRIVIFLEKEEN